MIDYELNTSFGEIASM